jgi:Fis family transcriptional regulator, factor for inversion stimulation protein
VRAHPRAVPSDPCRRTVDTAVVAPASGAINGATHSTVNGAAHVAGKGAARDGRETIEQCLLRSLEQYFRDLDGARPHQLHGMVMQAVERPLLKFALERASGNQSAAAELLGINRNTLRKKLIEHGMAEGPAPKPARCAGQARWHPRAQRGGAAQALSCGANGCASTRHDTDEEQ